MKPKASGACNSQQPRLAALCVGVCGCLGVCAVVCVQGWLVRWLLNVRARDCVYSWGWGCGCGWMCAAVEMHPNKHKIYMNTWELLGCLQSRPQLWPLHPHTHTQWQPFTESAYVCGNKRNFVVSQIPLQLRGVRGFNPYRGTFAFMKWNWISA